jgi:hypothetical protein
MERESQQRKYRAVWKLRILPGMKENSWNVTVSRLHNAQRIQIRRSHSSDMKPPKRRTGKNNENLQCTLNCIMTMSIPEWRRWFYCDRDIITLKMWTVQKGFRCKLKTWRCLQGWKQMQRSSWRQNRYLEKALVSTYRVVILISLRKRLIGEIRILQEEWERTSKVIRQPKWKQHSITETLTIGLKLRRREVQGTTALSHLQMQ